MLLSAVAGRPSGLSSIRCDAGRHLGSGEEPGARRLPAQACLRCVNTALRQRWSSLKSGAWLNAAGALRGNSRSLLLSLRSVGPSRRRRAQALLPGTAGVRVRSPCWCLWMFDERRGGLEAGDATACIKTSDLCMP